MALDLNCRGCLRIYSLGRQIFTCPTWLTSKQECSTSIVGKKTMLFWSECPNHFKIDLVIVDASGPKDVDQCLFVDSMVTVSDTGKELGEFCVTVQKASYKDEPCYLVHANSHGAIDNIPCGTSIMGESSTASWPLLWIRFLKFQQDELFCHSMWIFLL